MAELAYPGSHPRSGDPSVRPRGVPAIAAGLVAGIAYLVILSVLGSIIDGDGVWAPFHRISAMLLGPPAMENPDAFDATVVFTAIAVHAGLSMVYGLVMAFLIVEFSPASAPWLGAVCGLLLYLVNFYGFTGLYPWVAEMRGAVTLFAHMVFGCLLASCYWALHEEPGSEKRLSAA